MFDDFQNYCQTNISFICDLTELTKTWVKFGQLHLLNVNDSVFNKSESKFRRSLVTGGVSKSYKATPEVPEPQNSFWSWVQNFNPLIHLAQFIFQRILSPKFWCFHTNYIKNSSILKHPFCTLEGNKETTNFRLEDSFRKILKTNSFTEGTN